MKRTLMSLAAYLTLSGVGYAQISDMTIGYCNGQLPEKGEISYSESNANVEAAIYIPAGTVNTYSGNDIVSVNAGLASKLNIDELTVWLRTSLDGENLAEATITTTTEQKIVKGWNTVTFSEPYHIESGNSTGLYIGYTYHQKGSAFGVAAIKQPCANACLLKFGEGEWEDRSSELTLSVEGLLKGESLPKYNLMLSDVSVPDVYIIDRGNFDVCGKVKNLATYTISGFDVVALVDNVETSRAHVYVEGGVAYNDSYQFNVVLTPGITEIGTGRSSVTIRIENLTEGTDEDMSDNETTREFSIVEHDFARRILVEEFTTEKCPNCPRVANYMHNLLEEEKYAEDVIVVCHHVGFYTDWLTSSFDANYLWLYNRDGEIFAPAVITDRKQAEGTYLAFCPSLQSELANNWDNCLAAPAFVSLNISASYDSEDYNKLYVTVKGSKSMENLSENPTITVMLVENNIAAKSQAGATGDYIHNHVNRAVNSTWGDALTFDGDDYSYECEFALSGTWVRENMEVVAFISNYNSTNAADCEVANANRMLFSDIDTSALSEIVSDKAESIEIYSISGIRITNQELAPGIYIRKQGKKTEKIVIR